MAPAPSLWSRYFDTRLDCFADPAASSSCRAALEPHKADIAALLARLQPRRAVCLGAGFLNDLPLSELCQPEREVTLVDWLPQAPLRGLQRNIFCRYDSGPGCLLCSQQVGSLYCANFSGEAAKGAHVCSNYQALSERDPACNSYAPGARPHFLCGDITAGYASAFARQMEKLARQARTPQATLQRAVQLCASLPLAPQPLPLPDGCADFLTSSMVVSQFDSEPLGFVASLLEQQFGYPTLAQQADALQPLYSQLRKRLFLGQSKAHIHEMRRLLAPQGVAYFAVELFYCPPGQPRYFLLEQMGRVLDLLAQQFQFDLDLLDDSALMRRSHLGMGRSLIQSYALRQAPA